MLFMEFTDANHLESAIPSMVGTPSGDYRDVLWYDAACFRLPRGEESGLPSLLDHAAYGNCTGFSSTVNRDLQTGDHAYVVVESEVAIKLIKPRPKTTWVCHDKEKMQSWFVQNVPGVLATCRAQRKFPARHRKKMHVKSLRVEEGVKENRRK